MTISQDWNTAWEWFYSNADENEDPVTEAVADGKATNYYLWWIGLIVIYVLYYLMMVVGKPKVICSGNRLKEAIIEYCPILFECYWPTVWAFNNHVMTIVRAKCQRCPVIQYDRCSILINASHYRSNNYMSRLLCKVTYNLVRCIGYEI